MAPAGDDRELLAAVKRVRGDAHDTEARLHQLDRRRVELEESPVDQLGRLQRRAAGLTPRIRSRAMARSSPQAVAKAYGLEDARANQAGSWRSDSSGTSKSDVMSAIRCGTRKVPRTSLPGGFAPFSDSSAPYQTQDYSPNEG